MAAKIKGKHVLLVGQDSGFLEAGGIINLIVEGGKISFEINLAPARAASLELDPKLKTLAKSVKGAYSQATERIVKFHHERTLQQRLLIAINGTIVVVLAALIAFQAWDTARFAKSEAAGRAQETAYRTGMKSVPVSTKR